MCVAITKSSVLLNEGRILISIGRFGFACPTRIVEAKKKRGSAVCVAAERMKANRGGGVFVPRCRRFFPPFFFSPPLCGDRDNTIMYA